MAFRLDKGTLGKVETTPQGGIKVPAYVTKTGIFEYNTDDGKTIREYRPPEEVFNIAALATMPDAPVTNEHPPEHITPDNFKRFSVGHTKEVKQDEDKVAAQLVIQDGKTIRAIIEDGKAEVSCGYHCDVDETPGILPDGSRYDRIQRNIRYNHIAVVAHGRAGHEVRLRLDSKGNSTEEKLMALELIDGAEYEVGTSAHKAATKRREDSDKKQSKIIAELRAQVAVATKRADDAKAQLEAASKIVKEATSPQRLDHLVRVRGAVVRRAQCVLGSAFKVDGLSNGDIKKAAVAKAFPKMRFDGKDVKLDAAVIRKLFREIKSERKDEAAKSVPLALRAAPKGYVPRQDGETVTMEAIRQRRSDDESDRHRRPLAVSKSNPRREMDNFPTVQGSMLETMK